MGPLGRLWDILEKGLQAEALGHLRRPPGRGDPLEGFGTPWKALGPLGRLRRPPGRLWDPLEGFTGTQKALAGLSGGGDSSRSVCFVRPYKVFGGSRGPKAGIINPPPKKEKIRNQFQTKMKPISKKYAFKTFLKAFCP